MVAVENGNGKEAVRFHAEAIADFERKRVEIVNPALSSRPWQMALNSPADDGRDIEELEDDLDDLPLIEPAPPKKALAAPAAAKRIAAPVSLKLTGNVKKPPRT